MPHGSSASSDSMHGHGQQVRIVHAQVARELRQVVGRVLAVILAERAAEAVDVLTPDRQPGRQRVAAEALEILRAGARRYRG